MTRVHGYPRLHASLFDLGIATPRQYGGVGFAIDGMPTVVSAERDINFTLQGTEHLDEVGAENVRMAIERLRSEVDIPPMSVCIESLPPQHVGLGSKTTVLLGVLRAIAAEARIGLEQQDLQRLSGRGGTSGIGVHTFFDGGLVVDAGHRADMPRIYGPSSSAKNVVSIPPAIISVPMPSEWKTTLLLPEGALKSGSEEVDLFTRSTPMPDDEVFAAIGLGIFGLATCAMSKDFSAFVTSLRRLQAVGFKAREIAAQPDAVATLLDELSQVPMCGAGMSSMGPLTYAITESFAAQSIVTEIAHTRDVAILGTYSFRNVGYEIR